MFLKVYMGTKFCENGQKLQRIAKFNTFKVYYSVTTFIIRQLFNKKSSCLICANSINPGQKF